MVPIEVPIPKYFEGPQNYNRDNHLMASFGFLIVKTLLIREGVGLS